MDSLIESKTEAEAGKAAKPEKDASQEGKAAKPDKFSLIADRYGRIAQRLKRSHRTNTVLLVLLLLSLISNNHLVFGFEPIVKVVGFTGDQVLDLQELSFEPGDPAYEKVLRQRLKDWVVWAYRVSIDEGVQKRSYNRALGMTMGDARVELLEFYKRRNPMTLIEDGGEIEIVEPTLTVLPLGEDIFQIGFTERFSVGGRHEWEQEVQIGVKLNFRGDKTTQGEDFQLFWIEALHVEGRTKNTSMDELVGRSMF